MNDIVALRAHLFDTLAALRATDKPMEIERAKAIAEVARGVIDSAKVEVEYIKATGAKGSGFIAEIEAPKPGQPRLVKGRDMAG